VRAAAKSKLRRNVMRVLIVDDSSFIRQFTRQQLEQLGAICCEAVDGRDALEFLARDDAFDLMLVDFNMPRLNGLECIRGVREAGLARSMKVMMVTTEADYTLIQQALEFGADEFLMKPFTAQGLREKLMMVGFDLAA
jgi:two-component system chemotaxis response regulator CheY